MYGLWFPEGPQIQTKYVYFVSQNRIYGVSQEESFSTLKIVCRKCQYILTAQGVAGVEELTVETI